MLRQDEFEERELEDQAAEPLIVSGEDDGDDLFINDSQPFVRRRHVMVVAAFFGLIVDYALRIAMSVAAAKPSDKTKMDSKPTMFADLDWTNMQQGLVLGSFYIGYTLSQVPGGILAARYGAVRALGMGICFASLFSLLTPIVACNIWSLCVVRAFTGLSEGVVYPAAAQLLKHWVPRSERALLSTFIFSGAYLGTVAALPICALLLEGLGWRYTFYCWGAVGLLWTMIWCMLVHETPESDPSISVAEQTYIKRQLEKETKEKEDEEDDSPDDSIACTPISWCLIFSQSNIWALIAVAATNGYSFYVFLSDLPSYLSTVLDFSVAHTGRVALLPYIAISFLCPLSGALSDWLVNRNVLQMLHVRKLMCAIGMLLPGACMALIHAVPDNDDAIVILMILAVGLSGFVHSGCSVHAIDIGGAHTGLVFAIMNTTAQVPGILAPILTSYLVQTHGDAAGYRIVFWICAVSYAIGAVAFLSLASDRVVRCS